ncbi:hypothetical protein TrCOL_g5939 [Triparma columacea]|uniref:Tubulin-tyrosine ligase n=1 Tax=Triparma columacea TaxID=722753 RepID=A0A9W7GIX9_9STRA|nr:hypothetical protein TrCOL_g5939 [Triparma columacea]
MNFISALWTTFIQGSPHAAVDLKLASAYLYKVGGRSHGIAGLASITRKDTLALSTQRMERTSFGADFGYLPRTYVFPQQRAAFASETSSQARPPLSVSQWITKPSNDSCGANITVHSGSESALSSGSSLLDLAQDENGAHITSIVSEYLAKPFTIHKHKFDFRLYAVLVPSKASDRLLAYLYHDGLLRFATSPYGEHGGDLTNYSLNEGSANFVEDDENNPSGLPTSNLDSLKTHKWSLQSALPFLPPSFDFHNQATSILSKVATSAEIEAPTSTYELVGLDCMFDQGGKLWLLEVQNRPNLLAWSGLDRRIKSGLVDEVKELLEALEASSPAPTNWTLASYPNASEARSEAGLDNEGRVLFTEIMKSDKNMHYKHLLDKGR